MYARAIYPPNTPSRFAGLGYDPGWALGHIILLPLLSNLNKSMTMNLDEFKEWKGILQIRIIRNEQTGKHFFGYGDKAGAVTSKYPAEALDHPVISEVLSEESGEQFLLLHNAGDNPQFTTVAVL